LFLPTYSRGGPDNAPAQAGCQAAPDPALAAIWPTSTAVDRNRSQAIAVDGRRRPGSAPTAAAPSLDLCTAGRI